MTVRMEGLHTVVRGCWFDGEVREEEVLFRYDPVGHEVMGRAKGSCASMIFLPRSGCVDRCELVIYQCVQFLFDGMNIFDATKFPPRCSEGQHYIGTMGRYYGSALVGNWLFR